MNAEERDQLAFTVHMNGSGITVRQARDIAEAVIAAGYRKPPVIDTDKLLIRDGLLLLAVNYCTCGAGNPEHEPGCGFELLEDLTEVLAESGYHKREPRPNSRPLGINTPWIDPQCDGVADIDYEVNAQIRCKLEAGHEGDCEPEG